MSSAHDVAYQLIQGTEEGSTARILTMPFPELIDVAKSLVEQAKGYHRDYLEACASITQSRANHEKDVELIGQALIEEADERGWCSIYDAWIKKLNDKLYLELPNREKEYVVTHTFEVVVKVNVTASNEDDAKETAEYMYSSYEDEIDKEGIHEISLHDVNVELN
jgi:hypothetical protein